MSFLERDFVRRALRGLKDHLPELIALFIGVALRWRMLDHFDVRRGFDYAQHADYVRYIVKLGSLPPLNFNRTAYHAPLYYLVGAFGLRHGRSEEWLQQISVYAGGLRLCVLWIGLQRYLPNQRIARFFAMALAAILPCAIQVDGMVSNEAFCGLFSTLAVLLLLEVVRSEGRIRWVFAAGFSLSLTAALLSKVSATLLIPTAAIAALFELRRARFPRSLLRLAPLVLALSCSLAMVMPVYARHRPESGKIFSSGYDGVDKAMIARYTKEPYWKRRSPGFVLSANGWSILTAPYYPTECPMVGQTGVAHFWPVLMATTFADYYNAGFDGGPSAKEAQVTVNRAQLRANTPRFMSLSIVAGVLIALAAILASAYLALLGLRRRDFVLVVPLVLPGLAVLGQLHFAIAFPFDEWGPIKGGYLQFAMAPAAAAYGVAVQWLWGRRYGRIAALLEGLALLAVGAYVFRALRIF